ncbi:MAG: transglycosylase SLT domain-containing protein, partial [Monoglobus pectinilyticus]
DYNVDMPLILAVIGQESNYNAEAIGDNGESIGLMQIQPQHHQARMERLGVTDLTDPYQNVKVGIDLISELLAKSGDTEWVVTAYNAGAETANFNKAIGTRTEYTESVLILREEIENE